MNSPSRRAARLVGTPFRLQGREPGRALDCVGVVINAYSPIGLGELPRYGWRGHQLEDVDRFCEDHFDRLHREEVQIDDLLVFSCGRGRLHLGVATAGGLIHADAVLGRVVCRPWPPSYPIVRHWRPRISEK